MTGTPRRDRRTLYLRLALSLLLAAAVGGLISVYFSIHTANPCPCDNEFCIFGYPASGGADAHLAGAVTGLCLGGIGLLVVSAYLVWQFRKRLRRPFLALIVGFPVFYGCILASAWGVARMAWGPTRCSA